MTKTVGREVKGSSAALRARLKVFGTLLWSNGVPASEQKIQGGRNPTRVPILCPRRAHSGSLWLIPAHDGRINLAWHIKHFPALARFGG